MLESPELIVRSSRFHPLRCIPATALLLAALVSGCAEPATPAVDDAPQVAATEATIRAAIERGAAYLASRQLGDGSWATEQWIFWNVYPRTLGDFHAFNMASTGLAIKALIESDIQTPEVQAVLTKGEQWLLENVPIYRRYDEKSLFNAWGHLYAIEALLTMLEHRPGDDARRAEIGRLVQDQIRLLALGQSVRGGWGYYEAGVHSRPPSNVGTSFLTAAAMLALHRAQEAGFDVPQGCIRRALRALKLTRRPNNAFSYYITYHAHPNDPSAHPAGALARTPACNLVLHLFGDPRATQDVMRDWIARLIARNGWLDISRRAELPHQTEMAFWDGDMAPFVVAGYYYYFGHYHAALAMEHLTQADQAPLQQGLAGIVLPKQEPDGSWFDFVLFDYGKLYGTGYAMMTLQRCLPSQEP
ncbi:MAG: prenyltransferase/squalene oxidase repeat-containing protein [Planctomycetota bacterium]|jgi:hypothetical protein